MTLDEALDYIHRVDWRGSVPGLSRIDALLNKLGHPESAVKYIHITGTNGKGSTCAMTASVLQAAGYRTGLYTSPYIRRFNERMQINSVPIPDDDLCALVEEIQPLADSMADHPTEFELVTAIGLTWFARHHCDVVVCEVGMGGEFDATNIIPAPEVAALTNIGLDHTAFLGSTVEAIAATKSGIIKPGCHVVLYPCPPSVEQVVTARCRAVGAPLTVTDFNALHPISHSLGGQSFDWPGLPGLRLPLLGQHQLHNTAVALTILDILRRRGWHIPDNAIRAGLDAVKWPGRFQVVRRDPIVILDGGHNPQCMEALTQNVSDAGPEYHRLSAGSSPDGADRRAGRQGLRPHVWPAGRTGRPLCHRHAPQSPGAARRPISRNALRPRQACHLLRHHRSRRGCRSVPHPARRRGALLRLTVPAGRCAGRTGPPLTTQKQRPIFRWDAVLTLSASYHGSSIGSSSPIST